jgi:hypothetical protein
MTQAAAPDVQPDTSPPGAVGVGAPDPEVLAAVQARRSQLLECLTDLESHLASAARPRWGPAVAESLERLVDAFADHVAGAEGPGGLYEEIRRTAPRLGFRVDRLGAEHPSIAAALAELSALVASGVDQRPPDPLWVERVRREATAALGRLVRHRQRGADLLWEAFEQDLGVGG